MPALRFRLNCLNQTCTSSKSIMQNTKTICFDSAIFIEKKTVEIRLGKKIIFVGTTKCIICQQVPITPWQRRTAITRFSACRCDVRSRRQLCSDRRAAITPMTGAWLASAFAAERATAVSSWVQLLTLTQVDDAVTTSIVVIQFWLLAKLATH